MFRAASLLLALTGPLVPGSGASELESLVRQDEAAGDGWDYELHAHLWFPALDVSTVIDSVSSGSTRKNITDQFDDLEPGFMLAFEATPTDEPWGLIFDLSFADISGGGGALTVDAEQTFLEVNAYVEAPDLAGTDLFFGLRFIELDTTVVSGGSRASDSEVEIDPVLGVRTELPLGETWTANLAGSLAGFGFGTDLTWFAALGFTRPIGDGGGAIDLGWRLIDIDYDGGHELEARYSGPMLGLIWGF
jgi:hypothetical protein